MRVQINANSEHVVVVAGVIVVFHFSLAYQIYVSLTRFTFIVYTTLMWKSISKISMEFHCVASLLFVHAWLCVCVVCVSMMAVKKSIGIIHSRMLTQNQWTRFCHLQWKKTQPTNKQKRHVCIYNTHTHTCKYRIRFPQLIVLFLQRTKETAFIEYHTFLHIWYGFLLFNLQSTGWFVCSTIYKQQNHFIWLNTCTRHS